MAQQSWLGNIWDSITGRDKEPAGNGILNYQPEIKPAEDQGILSFLGPVGRTLQQAPAELPTSFVPSDPRYTPGLSESKFIYNQFLGEPIAKIGEGLEGVAQGFGFARQKEMGSLIPELTQSGKQVVGGSLEFAPVGGPSTMAARRGLLRGAEAVERSPVGQGILAMQEQRGMTPEGILGVSRMTDQQPARLDDDFLEMTPQARDIRAQQMGMTQKAYTGSTHPNIVEFDASLANPENDWGRAIYSSTSTEDVAANYATISGPDITQRIAIRAENLFDEMDKDEIKRIAEAQLGKKWEEMSYSEKREPLKELARKEIAGESLGVTYPLRINTQEYAVIGGKKPTYLEEPDYDSLARADIDKADFDDLDEYEDAVSERIWELRDQDPNSLPIRVSDALQNSDIGADQRTLQAIMEDLTDDLYSGEMKVQDLDAAIRKNALDAYDEEGNLLSPGEISSQVLRNLGFKGVVDNTVYEKFGAVSRGRQVGMAGVTEDTAHIITFPEYENTIRSEFAKFDPREAASKKITAGVGGLGLTGLLADQEDKGENRPMRSLMDF